MASYEKVVVGEDIPPSEKYLQKPKREPKFDKLMKALKIILKLARVDAYDLNGQVKDDEGNVIDNSDIARLTFQALSPGRVSVGEDEYIMMLFKAGIYPEELINDHYRNRLKGLYGGLQAKRRERHEKTPEPRISEFQSEREMPRLQPAETQTFVTYKRPAPRDDEEDEYEDPVPRKRKATDSLISINKPDSREHWQIPLDDDDDDE